MNTELINEICMDLTDLLQKTVVCEYDSFEELVNVEVFNVFLGEMIEVATSVSSYSLENFEKLNVHCIPIIYTPEQTAEYFPLYCEISFSKFRVLEFPAWSSNADTSGEDDKFSCQEEELAKAA